MSKPTTAGAHSPRCATRRAKGWTTAPNPGAISAATPAKTSSNPGTAEATCSGSTPKATVGPTNTHGATGTTNRRKRGSRRPLLCGPGWTSRDRVSGHATASDKPAMHRTRCGRYALTSGFGPHCAISADTKPLTLNPSDSSTPARRAPTPSSTAVPNGGCDRSRTHALPAARTAPVLIPASNRPTSSHGVASTPAMSAAVPAALIAIAPKTTGRRPYRSPIGPPSSSPGNRPTT